MYLVDTNVLSELRKSGSVKANVNVVRWLASVSADDLYVSPITLMEIEQGILSLERRDRIQAKMLRSWFSNLLSEFSHRILAIDGAVALRCAQLHVPNRRSDNDAWIAATALVHDRAVVTRNVAHFAPMGVRLINPWEIAASR